MTVSTIDLDALKTVLVEAINEAVQWDYPINSPFDLRTREEFMGGRDSGTDCLPANADAVLCCEDGYYDTPFDLTAVAQTIHEKVAAPLLARIAELETESLAARQLRMLRSEDGE